MRAGRWDAGLGGCIKAALWCLCVQRGAVVDALGYVDGLRRFNLLMVAWLCASKSCLPNSKRRSLNCTLLNCFLTAICFGCRLVVLQCTTKLCVVRDLTEHDIVGRIMRKVRWALRE